jgi:hypothetical protein
LIISAVDIIDAFGQLAPEHLELLVAASPGVDREPAPSRQAAPG